VHLFTVVEAELNGRCNQRCSYCPVSTNPRPQGVPKVMANETFDVLLAELARLNFAGRFSHHFLNEPLLRRDLEVLVTRIRKEVPGAVQVLFTNGDLLTEARYASLISTGIAEIVVTSHSGQYHPPRERQHVQFPSEITLSNRGGFLSELPGPTPAQSGLPCFAPSEILIVGANGDVLLCHEDARREHVMGNIMDQPLDAIWSSERFCQLRSLLASGRRKATAMCAQCTNFDLVAPGRAVDLWIPEKNRANPDRLQ
jgi:2-deoxy-scyllo-inosamine dehydrogenase (SAM-dependent)